jgi:O-antigen/teichoic acid export membrane protein
MLTRVVGMCLLYLSTVAAARALGAGAFGTFTAMTSLAQVAAVPLAALHKAALRSSPDDYSNGTLGGQILGGVILSIGLASAVLIVPPLPGSSLALAVSLLGGLLGALALVLQAGHRVHNDMMRGQMPYEVVRPGLMAVGFGACVAVGLRPSVLGALTIVTLACSGAVLAALPLKQLSWDCRLPKRDEFPTVLLLTGGTTLLSGTLPVLLAERFGESVQAGELGVLVRVSQLVSFGLTTASFLLAPKIAATVREQRWFDLELYMRRIRNLALLSGLPVVILFAIAPNSIVMFLGETFTGITVPLRLVLAASVVNLLTGPVLVTAAMARQDGLVLGAQLAGLLACALTTLSLLLADSRLAASYGYAVSQTTWNVLLYVGVARWRAAERG